MVKKLEMPIKQEKQLSSDFHMAMLRELEDHHEEKSIEWSDIDPERMLLEARNRVAMALGDLRYSPTVRDDEIQKQLVHAANYLSIAWAILRSRS